MRRIEIGSRQRWVVRANIDGEPQEFVGNTPSEALRLMLRVSEL